MAKQGSSRKGARRRQAIEAAGPREEVAYRRPAPMEEAVKLDLATSSISKEIARIETPLSTQEPSLPPHIEPNEHVWGQQSRTQGHRWVWLSFASAIVLLFISIALFNQHSKNNNLSTTKFPQLLVVSDEYDEQSPQFVFQKNPHQTRLDCIRIFRQFTASQQIPEVLPLIRQQTDTTALLAKRWQPWPSSPMLDNLDLVVSDSDDTKGRGFYWIQGKNQNGSPFLAFFVAEGDKLLLDWEATMEIGEARLSTLARVPATSPIRMRVIIAPATYYLPSLPENVYECYQITSLQDDTIVWGYVKRNSPAHQQICELLEQYSTLLEAKSEARVTLRLSKTDDVSSQNRFFITEVLHKDWVTP